MTTEEADRPTEWLRRLCEDRRLYRRLLADTGSLALAAYRLARARCRVQPVPSRVPTLSELRVAAEEIASAASLPGRLISEQLLSECEDAGLMVIVPLRAASAA